MAEFGKNLSAIRKARRLTQHQLADLLDVQQRVISRWETGAAKPHFDHVLQLARVLDVSLEQLMVGDDGESEGAQFEIRNKRLEELCRQVDRLSSEDQNVICHVMDSLIRKERVKAVMSDSLPHSG